MGTGPGLGLLSWLDIDPVAGDLPAGAVDVVPHGLAGPMGITVGVQHTVVVLRMLKVVFHGYSIAGRTRVPCQGQILFHDLIGVSPYTHVSAAAVEALGT